MREVVSSLRGDGLELSGALHTLVGDIPAPKVHLELAEDLSIDDPQRAQVLLRCVQEIVTNAARHAHAENLWLRVAPSPEGFTLSARDDGRGAGALVWGNGLTGMRERLESLGGRLELYPNPGRGFALTATLPA